MDFEWDPAKASQNLRKHKVSFKEASTVFGDALSVTFADPDHSVVERRFVTIGTTVKGRVIMVAHTHRGERVRIISARPLTQGERSAYEDDAD
jgi:uncharacterized protein